MLVEKVAALVIVAQHKRLIVVSGGEAEEDALRNVGVECARPLVSGLPNDTANVFIILTDRHLNSQAHILRQSRTVLI